MSEIFLKNTGCNRRWRISDLAMCRRAMQVDVHDVPDRYKVAIHVFKIFESLGHIECP